MPATMLVHPDELRPLTVKEYARLQQFPDDWKFEGNTINIYKQIGNAVPVGLGFAAGNAIMAHLKGINGNKASFQTSRYKRNFYTEFLYDFEKHHINNESNKMIKTVTASS